MTASAAIPYGQTGRAVARFQHLREFTLPLPTLVARLRAGIEAAGLWVLHEIDPQAILVRGGHAIGAARQILFFHPDLMVRLLQADPAALLEAPLKFAVMAQPDGATTLRWLDPAAAFARYDNPALTELGLELAAICERIAGQA